MTLPRSGTTPSLQVHLNALTLHRQTDRDDLTLHTADHVPTLINTTLGWSMKEAEILRKALMKFGVGNWSKILESNCLVGKTNAQMNLQTQRMLGQQSTAGNEHSSVHEHALGSEPTWHYNIHTRLHASLQTWTERENPPCFPPCRIRRIAH